MTTQQTPTLAAFLLREIAADEADIERGRRHNAPGTFANDNYGCLLVDPAHVLATCAAHQAIVEIATELAAWDEMGSSTREDGEAILRALAQIYSDRPGFNPAWVAS